MLHRLYAVLLLAAAALVLPAPAQAAACSGSSGVTVLVQFPDHTEVGCAAGDPSTGYQALSRAGFRLTMATGSGTGAICSIDSYPDHACTSMPPQSAYWAYFHAKPGGTWTYSSTGGGSYDPKPGTVEGWRFGSGSAPSSTPPGTPSTPKPSPTSKPTTSRPTATPTAHPTAGHSGAATPTSGSTTVAAPGASPTAPDATASGTSSPTGGPTATATDDTLVAGSSADAATAPRSRSVADHTSGSSWIWGVVLVVLVGAAAATTVVRRRKA